MRKIKHSIKFLAVAVLMVTVYSCFNDSVTPVDYSKYTPEREDSIISVFIDTMLNRGWDVDTTYAGVYYAILSEGDSTQTIVQDGDSIGINYTGFMADGSGVFDASAYHYSDGVMRYTYPASNFIPGWDISVEQLHKGGEGYFLVPSSLAYGSTGNRNIPPYSPLVFYMKLIDIYN